MPPADALICRDPATLKPRSDGTPVLVADPDGIWRDPGAARRLRGDGEIPGQLVFDDA